MVTRENFRLATAPTTAEFLQLSRAWLGRRLRDGVVESVNWSPYNHRTGEGGVTVTLAVGDRRVDFGITNYMDCQD